MRSGLLLFLLFGFVVSTVSAAEDSISMMPLFRGNGTDSIRKEHVSISPGNRITYRAEYWKLIVSAHTNTNPVPVKMPLVCELYDLKNDPGEKTNLAEERKELVADLRERLRHQIEQGRSTLGVPQKNNSNIRMLP